MSEDADECLPLYYGDRQGPVPPRNPCRYNDCDIYISGTGSDTTGNGSSMHPYATLAFALSVASNNQKIGVMNGTYRESNLSTSLTGLTVKAAFCDTPIFTVSAEYTTWAKTAGRTNVYDAAYTSALCYRVWNGATLLASTISVAACDAATNSYYFDDPNNVLYVNIGGAMPTAINVATTTNPVLQCLGDGFTWDGIITQWSLAGLRLRANNCLVHDSTFRYFAGYSGRYNIVWVYSGANSVVDSCSISGLNDVNGNRGVHIYNGVSDTIVRDCTIDNCYIGLYVQGTDSLIERCVASSVSDGVLCEFGSADTEVCYCTVYNFNSTGIQVHDSFVTAVIHHNIVHTAAAVAGLYNYAFMANDTANGHVQWYHNVAANLMTAPGDGIGFRTEGGSVVTAYNNISYNNKIGMSDSGGLSITNGDYNCVNGNTSQYDWPGNTWPAGANDIVVDPLFTAPATNDFTLQGASPCLNAGTFVAGVSELGPPTDIGRYET